MTIQKEYISTRTDFIPPDSRNQRYESNQRTNHNHSSCRIKVTSLDPCDDCLSVIKVGLISAALTPIVIPVVGTVLSVGVGVGATLIGAGVVVLGAIGVVAAGTMLTITAAVVCTAALPLLIAGAVLSCVL